MLSCHLYYVTIINSSSTCATTYTYVVHSIFISTIKTVGIVLVKQLIMTFITFRYFFKIYFFSTATATAQLQHWTYLQNANGKNNLFISILDLHENKSYTFDVFVCMHLKIIHIFLCIWQCIHLTIIHLYTDSLTQAQCQCRPRLAMGSYGPMSLPTLP